MSDGMGATVWLTGYPLTETLKLGEKIHQKLSSKGERTELFRRSELARETNLRLASREPTESLETAVYFFNRLTARGILNIVDHTLLGDKKRNYLRENLRDLHLVEVEGETSDSSTESLDLTDEVRSSLAAGDYRLLPEQYSLKLDENSLDRKVESLISYLAKEELLTTFQTPEGEEETIDKLKNLGYL